MIWAFFSKIKLLGYKGYNKKHRHRNIFHIFGINLSSSIALRRGNLVFSKKMYLPLLGLRTPGIFEENVSSTARRFPTLVGVIFYDMKNLSGRIYLTSPKGKFVFLED